MLRPRALGEGHEARAQQTRQVAESLGAVERRSVQFVAKDHVAGHLQTFAEFRPDVESFRGVRPRRFSVSLWRTRLAVRG